MKMKIKNFGYLFLSLLIILASCVRNGEPGPAGADGTDGIDGKDGADGNANVQTYVYMDPAWSSNSNEMALKLDSITQDVLDNDVILGYVQLASNNLWYSTDSYHVNGYFRTLFYVNWFRILAYNIDNTEDDTPPKVSKAKIIIIKSTNTTTTNGNGRALSPQYFIFKELEEAGVDINDYYQVAAYYNLKD